MTTTKTKTQAAKTTKSAKTTKTAARKTAVQAERTVKTVVRDSAYATVGAGDTAVELLKALPVKAAQARTELPTRVRTLAEATPKELQDRLKGLQADGKTKIVDIRTQAEKEFDTLAARGRKVITTVQGSAATRRALEQSRTARIQVKAAATSVRKALGASAAAVDDAAEKVVAS